MIRTITEPLWVRVLLISATLALMGLVLLVPLELLVQLDTLVTLVQSELLVTLVPVTDTTLVQLVLFRPLPLLTV